MATKTIADFERKAGRPTIARSPMSGMLFEAAGVEFRNGGEPGVKLSGWFIERHESATTKAIEVRYVRGCNALLDVLAEWKATAPKSMFRLHAPRSTTDAEREAIGEAGFFHNQ